MYKAFKKGSTEVIQGLHCHIPPKGYGYNGNSNKLVKVDILQRSRKKSEQYWERIKDPIPDWYKKKRKEEARQEAVDPDYFDSDLENFRKQEWHRRLYGVWVMINGVATYIPGIYYYFLTYWQLDVGKPLYRDTDRKFFYFLLYVVEDPNCYGMVFVTKRRQGKTAKGGVFLLEPITRLHNASAGIQSKTLEDAKKIVFANAVIRPFKYIPHFFRPIYDTAQGLTPKSELRFYKPNVKRKLSAWEEAQEELESEVTFKASNAESYDGDKLRFYLGDEIFKTKDVDIINRHEITKLCLLDENGNIQGKMLYTSTVEEMEGQITKYKKFWLNSDPTNPKVVNEKTKQTKTGLYKYFTPAYESKEFDKYGFPMIEENMDYYQAIRDQKSDDPAALVAEKRRNPFNEDEAFYLTSKECHFDAMKINEQLNVLSYKKNVWTTGMFEWKNGEKDTTVIWKPHSHGQWKVTDLPPDEDTNQFDVRAGMRVPSNDFKYASGIDPYDKLFTVSEKLSQGASYVKRKIDPHIDPSLSNKYVCQYIYRPRTPKLMYEDILMQCVYFGCRILVEDNKDGIIQYFSERGYGAYLMWLQGAKKPGISAAQSQAEKANRLEWMDEYITYNTNKIMFTDLLEDLLDFNVDKTKEFDASMAFCYTEIAANHKGYKKAPPKTTAKKGMQQYFRKFKS